MKYLDVFLEIVKYILPSVVVFITAYMLVGKFMQDKLNAEMREFKKQPQSIINPLKLQAYERLIVFLERISPQQLIQNNAGTGQTALQMKRIFMDAVNAEYNHNVSQQIYVSPQLWSLIKVVKEEVIDIINTSAESLGDQNTGLDLCKVIINRMIETQYQPTQKAIDFLKAEIQLYFA